MSLVRDGKVPAEDVERIKRKSKSSSKDADNSKITYSVNVIARIIDEVEDREEAKEING